LEQRPALSAHRSHNVAVLFGLSMFPVIGIVVVAIDYSTAVNIRAKMQEATDSAALAAATQPSNHRDRVAREMMSANLGRQAVRGTFTPAISVTNNPDGSVTVTSSGSVPTNMSSLVGVRDIAVVATSTAIAQQTGAPCFITLDPSADGGLRVNGNARVDAPECEAHVHSANSGAAFIFNSGARFDAKKFCVKGGAINRGITSGRVETGCAPAARTMHFGLSWVSGRIRAPIPAARMTAVLHSISVIEPHHVCASAVPPAIPLEYCPISAPQRGPDRA